MSGWWIKKKRPALARRRPEDTINGGVQNKKGVFDVGTLASSTQLPLTPVLFKLLTTAICQSAEGLSMSSLENV